MLQLNRKKILTVCFIPGIAFYAYYLYKIVFFPFEWEPTDGDHLNFANRISEHLPIFYNLQSGNILSVYNPLYHYLIASTDLGANPFVFARIISAIFWILCPVLIYFYFKKRTSRINALMAAIAILFPIQSGLLVDMVQVTPVSTMVFLFLITILFADSIQISKPPTLGIVTLGFLSCLTFLAKQQGIIVFFTLLGYFLIARLPLRRIILFVSTALLTYYFASAYVSLVEGNHFLSSTVTEIPSIIKTYWKLSVTRLSIFLVLNISFIVTSIYALMQSYLLRKINIWEVSLLMHIPFLLFILKNGGGGSNYLTTFWISIVVVSCNLIFSTNPNYNYIASVGKLGFFCLDFYSKKKTQSGLHVLLSLSILLGQLTFVKDVARMNLPNQELREIMISASARGELLVEREKRIEVLANRNIGIFLDQRIEISNEGCSLFGAWENFENFDKRILLERISEQKYDYITTGLTPYPQDIQSTIDRHYIVIDSYPTNYHFGRIATQSIYGPRTE